MERHRKLISIVLLSLLFSLLPGSVGAMGIDRQDDILYIEVIREGGGYLESSNNNVWGVVNVDFYEGLYPIGAEVISKRSENSKTYYLGKNEKGLDRFSLEISMGVVHYKDNYNNEYEEWKNIDLTPVNGVVSKAPYILTISGKTVTVYDKKTGSVVSLDLAQIDGKTVSSPILEFSKGKATAQNIATDTDLEITWNENSISFSRILKSSKAPMQATFGISQNGNGIKVEAKAKDSKKEIIGNKNHVNVTASIVNGVLTETIVDKSELVYPVKIDPVINLQVGASADDCCCMWGGASWGLNTASAYGQVGCATIGTTTKVGSGLRWQGVNILQSALIDNAYISVYASLDRSNVVVNSYITGNKESNAAAWSDLANYQSRRGTIVGGADNTKITTAQVAFDNISAWTASNWYNTPDISIVVQEIVNQAGWVSGNAMALFWDDHDGRSTQLSVRQRIWSAYDTGAATAPKLYIDYQVTIIDTIVATSVSDVSATTGGNITKVGTGLITIWGTQYGTTGGYGSWANNTGSITTAPYEYADNLAGLVGGELYYFRAFAVDNTSYVGYGSQSTFFTLPDCITDLRANTANNTAINLAWTIPASADNAYIRYSDIGYPLVVTDGILAYNGTGTSYSLGSLNGSTTYYFSGWGWASEGTSSAFSSTSITTSNATYTTPVIATGGASSGLDFASVSGTVGADTFTEVGFDYGLTNAYGMSTTQAIGITATSYTMSLTSLAQSSTYHYRAKGKTAWGAWYYGSEATFTTGGGAVLYESNLQGCNTTWNQSYESFLATNNVAWKRVYGSNWTSETFTTTSAHSVNQIKLWARRAATAAAGYMYVSIRDAALSDNITSPDLAIGLYSIAYISTAGGPIEVNLESEVQLEAGKKYAVTIRSPAADATNYTEIWYSTAGSYTGGNMVNSDNGGSAWISDAAADIRFEIIGKPQPIYGNVMGAQTFSVGNTPHTAYKFRLILGRVGSPGDVEISLRSATGGVISKTVLSDAILNGNAMTLDKTAYDCILIPEKGLIASANYSIVVAAPSGDRYNYVIWCADNSGGSYTGGSGYVSTNSGVSWVAQAYDHYFEVWGNPVFEIANVRVFKNYLTTGDWLICSTIINVLPPYYDNNEDPSTRCTFSLIGSTTGTVYASTPCELWDKNPIAIYLNPTQAGMLSWGGDYKCRLSNIDGTVFTDYAIQPTDWNAASLVYLDNWSRNCAKDMEEYQLNRKGKTVQYLSYASGKGWVLNQDGGAIFNVAIPRLQNVRPNLFLVTTNVPDLDTTDYPTPGLDDKTPEAKLGSYIWGLIQQGAAASGMQDANQFGAVMMLAIYALIAFGTVIKGYAWAGMIAAIPVLFMAAEFGLLSPQVFLIVITIVAFLFVNQFIWSRG